MAEVTEAPMASDSAGTASAPARPPRWHAALLFTTLSVLYFAVGATLIVRYHLLDGDGPSRVAHTGFAMMSREPHLSAIGFVWNPLPSLVQLPLLPLSHWWPELKTYGLAGLLQSAPFMAGAALLIRQIAFDRGIPALWRRVAVLCFAVNPVIVIYGGMGLSEAAEMFCILWCIRYLLRWLDTQRVGDLAWAGIALGAGYLARYEIIPAACGAAALVAAITLARSPQRTRVSSALLNVAIVVFPVAVATAAWAFTGWVVNGELLAIVSSQYGNSSQVATALTRETAADVGGSDWLIAATRLLANQPFAGLAAALAVALAALRRRADPLVPLVTFGAILAFALWSEYSGTTFGWFRYYLPAIPMVVVIALCCWNPVPSRSVSTDLKDIAVRLGAALMSVSLVVGIPVTVKSMLNADIGNHQLQFGLNSLIHPDRYPADEQWYRRGGVGDRLVADYLDRKNLPEGSVLMDTFMNWGVWLASDNVKQFLIDTDFDYTAALNRPWEYGVSYFLVTNPRFNAAQDTIAERYPTLWEDGAGIGTLVYSAAGVYGEENWRLYRITEPEELRTTSR